MKLTILGSGTYQPELKRHSAAYLVETEKSKICFDFGRGAIDQLLKVGVHVNQIDAIFLTHWHADHVADLMPLIHITVAGPADLAVDWIPRKQALQIYGPEGTMQKIGYLMKVSFLERVEMDMLEIHEISNEPIKEADWRLTAYMTKHNPAVPALAFRLENAGKILAYSGDSTDSDGLRKAVQGADLAVIEAGWPEEVNPKTHLTGPMAGKIAQEQEVKKLILTHASPYYLKNGDPVKDAKKCFTGEVVLAEDLMEFEV